MRSTTQECKSVVLRLTIDQHDKVQNIRAHDGKIAWTATRLTGAPEMIKEELPPEAADELLADAGVLPPLIKLWREGAKLELLESVTIDEVSAFNIQAQPELSTASYNFHLSKEDYRLIRHESHHPKKWTTTTSYSDYREDSSIRVSMLNIIESDQACILLPGYKITHKITRRTATSPTSPTASSGQRGRRART